MSVQGPVAKSYSYDTAGQVSSDGSTSFIWNAAGRMDSATTGGLTYYYKTNGFGERVLKYTSSPANYPLRFLYDEEGHLLGEYTTDSTARISQVRQETIWLGDLPVAVVKKDPSTQQYDITYIHADHLNTPQVILNTANVPVWRWDNADVFGNGLPDEDPDGDGIRYEYNLRFPGQYYDQEAGLHYNYFREYDPKTGRYLSSDPIGLAGGMNTYAYVGGNPVNYADPMGLTPEGAAIGGAIGGGVGGVIGGLIGGLIGGGGGTLVAPGVGTIGGGIAGAGEGAVNGAVIGAVIGDIVSDAIKGKAAANDDTYDQCGPDDGDPCDEILKELQELRNDILNDYISGLTTELELEKLRRLFNEQVIDFRKQCPRQGQQLDLL